RPENAFIQSPSESSRFWSVVASRWTSLRSREIFTSRNTGDGNSTSSVRTGEWHQLATLGRNRWRGSPCRDCGRRGCEPTGQKEAAPDEHFRGCHGRLSSAEPDGYGPD